VVIAEVVLTFFFVLVIHGATDKRAPKALATLAIGLTLTLIHLISMLAGLLYRYLFEIGELPADMPTAGAPRESEIEGDSTGTRCQGDPSAARCQGDPSGVRRPRDAV
jgi:hypothetical protein